MNAMQVLSWQPWVERLGWTLIHFLWQGVLISVLYAAVRQLAGTWKPDSRYLLSCAALLAMTAAPPITWGVMRPADATSDTTYRIRVLPVAAPTTSILTTTTRLSSSAHISVTGTRRTQFLLWVVLVWLAGALVLLIRLAGGWMIALRMRSVLVRAAPLQWQQTLAKLGLRIGLSRKVRLWVSARVQVPVVVGWLRPLILVPVGAFSGLPTEDLEALLLHELAHIRRHDYLINLLQSVAEALLFYHPAVWWVSAHIRGEREICCDDAAVSVSGNALTYARALVQLESNRPAHSRTAVAANGGSLAGRIARLLGHSRAPEYPVLGPSVLAVSLLLAAAVYGVFAQSGVRPTFQRVSIARNTSNWKEPTHHPMGVSLKPDGLLRAQNASLMLLIQFAYAPHDSAHALPLLASQVIGGPGWIATERYDIEARPNGRAGPRQMPLILQTLLAHRFKLKLHRVTKVLAVYDLVTAADGLRLPAAKEVDCALMPPDGSPPPGTPGQVDCGYVAGPMNGSSGRLRFEGNKVHMADFIAKLAMVLGRPVIDKTGFGGAFDLNLSFTADDATMGLPGSGGPGDPGGSRLPRDPKLPNIFTTLERQVGLKLVPANHAVDVLAIDHIEKPSLN